MEEDDYTGSGGSTPVQDEPMYMDGEGPQEEDNEMMNIDHAKGNDSDMGSETGSQRGGIRVDDEDAEYVSDGGEVEREEVEQDIVEDEEMHSGDEGPASPGGSYDGSPQGSPDGDRPLSPETPPMSPGSGPASPGDSPPASPAPSGSPPGSPIGSASPPGSPVGSAPNSPAVSGSPPGSPSGSAVRSPMGSGSPASPAGSAPGSPAGSGSAPGSPREIGSPPGSPAEVASPPGSPVASPMYSPANSCPASPSGIEIPNMSPGSGPASPTGSASPPRSPAGSGSPHSPAGSGSPPQSPAGSGSPPQSPTGSGSVPGSPTGSRRSRSGSRDSRSRSRSASGSRASKSRSRSRSGSPASSRSRSRSSSRSSRSRSRSGSPGSRRSRSGSESSRGSPVGRRRIDSDSEDEGTKKSTKKKAKGSDDEDDSDKESEVGELIADIFGSSDEEEEFEGFGEEDVEAANKKKEKKKTSILSDDDEDAGEQATGEPDTVQHVQDDSDEGVNPDAADFVSDFDLMMMKKKEENRKNRKKRKDFDIINDNDDLIVDMIKKMKEAAEADRELNTKKEPATRKLKYLKDVNSQLKKSDLHLAFLDCGVLSAMTEWLAPLPDKSLPHLQIRDSFLKHLQDFPSVTNEGLKVSGIGKAVMYLYKHPRETKRNKERCGKLINDWSRPIFNLTSNYKMLSKEEREQRDYEQLPKRRRLSTEGMTPRRDIDNALSGDQQALRPGDKGWIMRARVPMPSNKDYVVRPKWKVEEMVKTSRKKDITRYEKHARSFAEKKKFGKGQRAVTISIEGRKMAL